MHAATVSAADSSKPPACARPDVWRADTLAAAPARTVASAHAALDAALPGGGWPLGALVELLQQAPVQAVWRLLAPALAALDGAVVLVGAPLPPFAPALEAQGIAAERLLWVDAATPAERAWAAEQALACAEVGAVLLWLHPAGGNAGAAASATAASGAAAPGGGVQGAWGAEMARRPAAAASTVASAARRSARSRSGEAPSPSLLLRRLHLAAQGRGKLLVALRPEAVRHTPSCAVLRLALQEAEANAGTEVHRPGRAVAGRAASGSAAAACAEGPGLRVQVLKRRGPPLELPLHLPRHGAALQALLAAQQRYRARLRSGWDAVPRPASPAASVSQQPARSRAAAAQPAALAVLAQK